MAIEAWSHLSDAMETDNCAKGRDARSVGHFSNARPSPIRSLKAEASWPAIAPGRRAAQSAARRSLRMWPAWGRARVLRLLDCCIIARIIVAAAIQWSWAAVFAFELPTQDQAHPLGAVNPWAESVQKQAEKTQDYTARWRAAAGASIPANRGAARALQPLYQI